MEAALRQKLADEEDTRRKAVVFLVVCLVLVHKMMKKIVELADELSFFGSCMIF